VKHKYNGLLCHLKDAADLAEKMREMASLDEDNLRMFGTNGRQKAVSEFDESLVIHKYLQTLSALRVA